MTYYISHQTHNGVILSETRTTDEAVYTMLLKHYETQPGMVITWEEG